MCCPMFLGDPPQWGCNSQTENQCDHSETSPQIEDRVLNISLKSHTHETSKRERERDRQEERENVCALILCLNLYFCYIVSDLSHIQM